jgi:23S rRNA pseudouridine2605 synthase
VKSERRTLSRRQASRAHVLDDAGSQKLHKVLAQAGLGSRRAMETWIREGRVTVNGKVAQIGARVDSRDVITAGNRVLRRPTQPFTPRVLIYHKPEGEITTRHDPQKRDIVFAGLPRLRGAKWVAVGRLDYNTCGLLIFTTSGEIANRMMHPRFAIEREYAVRTLGRASDRQLQMLRNGIDLADGQARCLRVDDEGGEGANHWYRLVLTEGRNRVVRRMFEALGLTVSRLMRVRFGIVTLPPRLRRGQWFELPDREVNDLLAWLGLPEDHAAADVRGRSETRSVRRRSVRAR